MGRPTRFRPPQVVVSRELEWLLVRAFSVGEMRLFCLGPHEAVVLSRRLDLAPRIAHRTPRALLDQELPATGVAALVASLGAAALANERLLGATREVLEAGAEIGGAVLLKGMALFLTGRTPVEARGASDVDILVAERSEAAMAAALERRGFHADTTGPPCEHQLPGFHRAPGETVEVHRFLPGVRQPGRDGFASLGSLEADGLLERLPGLPGPVFTPSSPVLMAHALVHGLAQHGFAPHAYPLMRMIADLIDLGVGAPAGRESWERAGSFVARHVGVGEREGAWELCRHLVAGEPWPEALRREDPAEALLAHIVAGALDPCYERSLRLRIPGSAPSLLPRPLAWLRDVGRSLWPTTAHLDALEGPNGSRGRLPGARVRRIMTQVRRAFGSAWSVLRLGRGEARPAVQSAKLR